MPKSGEYKGLIATWSVGKVASTDKPTRCSGRIHAKNTSLSFSAFVRWCGWGLIRANFLTPYYDITFDTQADAYKIRHRSDRFADYNHLAEAGVSKHETIYFFGGITYLPLFYRQVDDLAARKMVYYTTEKAVTLPSKYVYTRYDVEMGEKRPNYRNWQYRCGGEFIDGRLPQ